MDKETLSVMGQVCCVAHDWVLDEKGHECRRCHVREEIIGGQTFVIDPRVPEREIHLKQNGVTVGRIVNVGVMEMSPALRAAITKLRTQ